MSLGDTPKSSRSCLSSFHLVSRTTRPPSASTTASGRSAKSESPFASVSAYFPRACRADPARRERALQGYGRRTPRTGRSSGTARRSPSADRVAVALPLTFEEQPGEPVQVMKSGVGPVKAGRISSSGRDESPVSSKRAASSASSRALAAETRHERQARHGGLEHAVQGRVLGKLVEPAGKAVGPDSVTGELAHDIKASAQQPQVFLASDIAAGQAAPHGG